jgi:hypothetical protein
MPDFDIVVKHRTLPLLYMLQSDAAVVCTKSQIFSPCNVNKLYVVGNMVIHLVLEGIYMLHCDSENLLN